MSQAVSGGQRTVSLNRNPSVSHGALQTGIGIVFGRPEVGTDYGGETLPYTIHRVSKEGTAHQSGLIFEGDLLLRVNGESVEDMTAEQITSLILGKPSSPLTITIETPLAHDLKPHSSAATPASALRSLTPSELRSSTTAEPLFLNESPSYASPVQRGTEQHAYIHRSPRSSRPSSHHNGGSEPRPAIVDRFPLEAQTLFKSSPQVMPVAANDRFGDSPGSHKPIPDLRFEATVHSGVNVDSNGKMAHNSGGAYWACIRLTPAVPPNGKWRALFEISRPYNGHPAATSDTPCEGCGSFIGVCNPERHNAAKSRGMGSAHAWMVSLRTGTRFHNGKDLPAPYASPAPTGSIIAVMIDMDNKLTRIQVDGDIPVR